MQYQDHSNWDNIIQIKLLKLNNINVTEEVDIYDMYIPCSEFKYSIKIRINSTVTYEFVMWVSYMIMTPYMVLSYGALFMSKSNKIIHI